MTVICFAIGADEIALGADSRGFYDDGSWFDTAQKLAVADAGLLSVAGLACVATDLPNQAAATSAGYLGDADDFAGTGQWIEWIDLADRILRDPVPVPVPARMRWQLIDERILEICQRALEIGRYATDGMLCRDLHQHGPSAVTPLLPEREIRTWLTTGWVDPDGICWLQQTSAWVVDDSAYVYGHWMHGTGSAPMLFAEGPDPDATRILNEWIASEPYLLELLEMPGAATEVAEEVIRQSMTLLADHDYAPGGRARSVSLRSNRRRRR